MKKGVLYTALGELFYAVCAVDGIVDEKEWSRLKKELDLVWDDWDEGSDEFGFDATHFILYAFDALQEQGVDSKEAWLRFKSYYLNTKANWTPDLKNQVERTAAAMALAKSGYNKAELGILADLHLLFEKR